MWDKIQLAFVLQRSCFTVIVNLKIGTQLNHDIAANGKPGNMKVNVFPKQSTEPTQGRWCTHKQAHIASILYAKFCFTKYALKAVKQNESYT